MLEASECLPSNFFLFIFIFSRKDALVPLNVRTISPYVLTGLVLDRKLV